MIIFIKQENSHISEKEIWKEISSKVFVLDESETRILRYLALHGPLNLNQIGEYTSKKYANSFGRWGVKKRLIGTKRFRGLIPYNFVCEEDEPKHRFGKQEKKYYLTLRGIMASCSECPLEENYFVKQYANKFKNKKNSKLSSVVLRYFVEQIKLVLVWYFANGYQLQELKTGGYHVREKLDYFEENSLISFYKRDKDTLDTIRKTLRNCIKLSTIINLIGGDQLESKLSMLSYGPDFIKSNEIRGDYGSLELSPGYFKEWSLDLGNKEFTKRPETDRSEIEYSDLYSKKLVDEIDKEVEEMGFKIHWHDRIDKEFPER